jgi:hypothetical protein
MFVSWLVIFFYEDYNPTMVTDYDPHPQGTGTPRSGVGFPEGEEKHDG